MSERTKYSKSDLIALLIQKESLATLTKKEVKTVVDELFSSIEGIVVDGGAVTIQGLGRFFTREAKAKSFKKITTGEIVAVGERTLPKMKFSKSLVNKVKGA